ncbi:carboxylate-amine ligase [Amycolatopsis sp. H20-H5]|uniref:carboxylate-amine ligase n=1 Tax=Amycolatopsis sp. H20-H5 TaxID=3046309 RepID=UPI002DBAA696|nr:glutamate--cysteine ligase [Amycolatopsis sp. H20-H5]MEC3981498.1 glutamate--cysteine ligase [Amycolatopsis sp. H20-H5]
MTWTVPTLGVEEEFFVVDDLGRLSGQGAALAGEADEHDGSVQQELNRCQVESATGICRTAGEVLTQLRELRQGLAVAAARRGTRILPSGTPVVAEDGPATVTPHPRYERMAKHFGATLRGVTTCGCHVHVAIPDRERGVQVIDQVRPWLPALLALTANSPLDTGYRTGYHSWRHLQWIRWPTAGAPPRFGSLDRYEELVDELLRTGAALDRAMVYWDVRLSDDLPTVEFRVSDVAATPEDATLLAVLVRALVTTALDTADAGTKPPELPSEVLRARLWQAAHGGLTGGLVHPVTGELTSARAVVGDLLARLRPALSAADDLDFALDQWAALRERGGGAARQLAALGRRRRTTDVADLLAVVPTAATVPER